MKTQKQREFIIQSTILSFIIACLFPLVAFFIELIIRKDIFFNVENIFLIIRDNPVHWICLSLAVIFPVTTYMFLNFHIQTINKRQREINKEKEKSKHINEFLEKLITGDFSVDNKLGESDITGDSLINLRDTLKSNKEHENKIREEENIRHYIADGLAKFGEILRKDNDNLEKLAYNVISNLCNYINAIQGGFYMISENGSKEKIYDLIAFYAYNRKKFANRKIKFGEGLIGTSGLERKTIYLTDVPENYVTVTSGLGKANPRSILIVPLITNEELFGVLEFAAFNKLQDHEIEFIERVAESTASTLSTVKMNLRTANLLKDTKEQAQAMAAQEEEMRQNMEELKATQEEAARQTERFIKLENTVNHTLIRAEYNVDGILNYANTKFLKKLEYNSNSEVEGKHISMFISKKDEDWFNKLWEDLSKGGRHFEGYMKHATKTGKELWTIATYTCIRNEDGIVDEVLFLALDTTEQKKLSLDLEGIVDAVNRSGLNIVFDTNGNIIQYNDALIYLLQYSEKEVVKLNISDLIDPLEMEIFNKKWENIVNGIGFQGQFKIMTKEKEQKWMRGAFSAVYDMYGDVAKIVFIGYDNTKEKLIEIEYKKQNEILKSQEKMLRESEKSLQRKLKDTKREIKEQYSEIEKIKIRNERVLEESLDAIVTTDNNNKIIYFNKAAEKIFGYSKSEVLEKDVEMLFSKKAIEEDQFVEKYVRKTDKIVGVRKKVKIKTIHNKEIPVLILLSKAQVNKEDSYTSFIQTIES